MELENRFIVPLDRPDAMKVLTDVPRITPCIPGASLTGMEDGLYSGQANVRLGPVALSFKGTASITSIDNKAHTAQVKAQGSDKKGRGQAEAIMTFALEELENGQTEVIVRTDVLLSGSIAQYGRASGLINVVAGQIVSQFSENLKTDILEKQGDVVQQGDSTEIDAEAKQQETPTDKSIKRAYTDVPKNELNVFALIIAIVKSWFTSSK